MHLTISPAAKSSTATSTYTVILKLKDVASQKPVFSW